MRLILVKFHTYPAIIISALAGEIKFGATRKSCPPPTALGYHVIPELGYYKVHDENKSWKNADEICRQEGTHLLIINSEFEHQATKSMINRRDTAHWIGIHDQYKEGQYVTVFSKCFSQFIICKQVCSQNCFKDR